MTASLEFGLTFLSDPAVAFGSGTFVDCHQASSVNNATKQFANEMLGVLSESSCLGLTLTPYQHAAQFLTGLQHDVRDQRGLDGWHFLEKSSFLI